MANATILYACTPSGLSIFNKPGTLNEWLPARMALEGQAVLAVWAEPGPPIRVVAAAADPDPDGNIQILVSENGGRDWESKLEAPVTALLGTQAGAGSPATLYAGMAHGGMAASIDAGLDWGILPGIDEAPGAIRYIMVAGEQGVFYVVVERPQGNALLEGNPDQGRWHVLPVEGVKALSWDPEAGDLYAATREGVHLSADEGATWPLFPGSPRGCTDIVVIPGPANANPSILVSTESALLASNDVGASWHDLGFPQPGISAIARDPERRDRLYAATSTGYIFESGNRGQAWQPVTSSPQAAITNLFVIRF